MNTRIDTFEENLNNSYEKLFFLHASINHLDRDVMYIDDEFAKGTAQVIKSIMKEIESAKEIYENSRMNEYIDEIKKDVGN